MEKDYQKIGRLLRPYPFRLLCITILNIFSVVFSIFSITMLAPFLSIIFNQAPVCTERPDIEFSSESLIALLQYKLGSVVETKGTTYALAAVIIFVFLLFVLKNIFSYLSIACSVPMRTKITKNLRDKCYQHLLILPLSFYDKSHKGDVMSRVINDIQEVDNSILQYVQQLIKEVITILFFFGMLLFLNLKFTFFVLVTIPIIALIISSIQRKLKKKSITAKQQESKMLAMTEESIYGLKIIKAFNSISYQLSKFIDENIKYNRILVKINRLKDLSSPLSDFLGMCLVVIILIAGSQMIAKDSGFSAEIFITYLILFTQIINPIKIIADANANFKKGFASMQRIDELLKADEKIKEVPDACHINSFEKSIRFEHVNFAYDEKQVLFDINFEIPKGKMIAICGNSGSGKSTIADLLPRFYDIAEGAVYIDDIDIRNIKLNDMRAVFSIVSQESILFNDTLFNNIAMGQPDATDDEVWKAAEMAQIDDFIRGLELGMQTEVGDRGMKLSGGQRQRINIARAFLKNAPILILDEATSALDANSEKLVQNAITNLMKDKTSIVIAHRLSTIFAADEILVLEEGRIKEHGTHQQLIQHGGLYKKLVDLQTFK